MKKELFRIQLDVTKEVFDELNSLQEDIHAASRAEVFRNAIGVLKWVTNNIKAENKIIVIKKNGKNVEVAFPYLLI